jgi:phosphatidylglycerophosphate synthase
MLSSNRQKFSGFYDKVGKKMSFAGANTWTAVSLILGIVAAYMLANSLFLAAALAFAIAAFCDSVDGAVARYTGKAGKLGAFYDTIADRYVEFFIIAGLFFAALPDVFLPTRFWLCVYLFGSLMTTYAKAAAKEKGLIKEEMKHGILERAERMILLFVGMVSAAFSPVIFAYILILLAALSNITALQRIKKAAGG